MAETSKTKLLPVFDKYKNIVERSGSEYVIGYKEGQTLFATDINKVFKDEGGIRTSDLKYYYIEAEEGERITTIEFLDKYIGNFIVLKYSDRTKTFFIDGDGNAIDYSDATPYILRMREYYAVSKESELSSREIESETIYYLSDVEEWVETDVEFDPPKIYKWKKTITEYGTGDVDESIIFIGSKAIDGEQGPIGPQGPTGPQGPAGLQGELGPGLVYRGEWASNSNLVFYNYNKRVDVVKYSNNYYYFKGDGPENNTTPNAQSWVSGDWEEFGASFSSVATGLLLADESYVKNTINVGTNASGDSANITIDGSSNNPYISIGQEGEGKYGKKGIFLGMDNDKSKLSLQDTSNTNKLSWDGSKLSVVGDLGGQIGKLQIGTAQNGITIDENGIKGVYSRQVNGITEQGTSFELNKNGNAEISGNITALTGSIGGFTISNDVLYNDTSGEPKPGTMNSIWLSGVGKDSNLSIANSNPEGQTITRSWLLTASKNFGVDKNGIVYATDAKISGEISNTSEMHYERYSVIPRKHITLKKNDQTTNDPIVYYDNTKWKIKTIISEKGITTSLYSGTDSRYGYSYESGNGSPEIYKGDFNILTTMNASTNVHTITNSPQPIILGSSSVGGDGVYTGLGIYSNDYLSLTMKEKNIIGSRSYYFDSSMKKILDEKIEIGDGDWERVEVSSGKDIHFYPYRKAYFGHSTILSEQHAVSVTSLPSLQHYYINGVKENWLNADGSSSRQQLFMLCGTTTSIPANSWVAIETLTNVRVLSVVANTYRANDSSLSNVEGGCQVYWSRTLDRNNSVTTVYIGSDVTYETRVSWMIIGYRSLDKYAPGQ